MENLDQNKAIYFRNELVNFIHFEKIFFSENLDNEIEERVVITIGTAILNVATKELYNK